MKQTTIMIFMIVFLSFTCVEASNDAEFYDLKYCLSEYDNESTNSTLHPYLTIYGYDGELHLRNFTMVEGSCFNVGLYVPIIVQRSLNFEDSISPRLNYSDHINSFTIPSGSNFTTYHIVNIHDSTESVIYDAFDLEGIVVDIHAFKEKIDSLSEMFDHGFKILQTEDEFGYYWQGGITTADYPSSFQKYFMDTVKYYNSGILSQMSINTTQIYRERESETVIYQLDEVNHPNFQKTQLHVSLPFSSSIFLITLLASIELRKRRFSA